MSDGMRDSTAPLNPDPCTHSEDVICTECRPQPFTNGFGFPHSIDAKGRTPKRPCSNCKELVTHEQWDTDFWLCVVCAGDRDPIRCPETAAPCSMTTCQLHGCYRQRSQ